MSLMAESAISAWMKKAEATGELKDNPHFGKKLDMDDYLATPAHLRMGMKILKNAGVTPPAVDLANAVAEKKAALTQASDAATRDKLKQELVELDLKYRVALDSLNKL